MEKRCLLCCREQTARQQGRLKTSMGMEMGMEIRMGMGELQWEIVQRKTGRSRAKIVDRAFGKSNFLINCFPDSI